MANRALSTLKRAATLLLVGALLPLISLPAQADRPDGPRLSSPEKKEIVNQPHFWWTEVPKAIQYKLEVALDSRFSKVLKTEYTAMNHFIDTSTWPAGSYWWRVKVTQPFESKYSPASSFTRRWLVSDADGAGTEVARPDNVMVEDVSPGLDGLQAATNLIKISWEPVADASYYVVEFDHLEAFDPDSSTVPPGFGESEFSCKTPHTIMTPNYWPGGATEPALPQGAAAGPVFDLIKGEGDCTLPDVGSYAIRVRAVDVTVDGRLLYSLWSDEARNEAEQHAPGATVFTVEGTAPGSPGWTPATQASPADKASYIDTPVLEWDPVSKAAGYKVVIARDPDFTTEVAHFLTSNTRLIPLGRIPEDNADRSYFWYVLPCSEFEQTSATCLSSNTAVNRPGQYRSFVKESLRVDTQAALLQPEPWLHFRWQPFMKTERQTNRELGRSGDSIGGIDFYEIQTRLKGTEWPAVGTMTDLPDLLPENLPFGQYFKWRVRVVDGSGQTRPWSKVREDRAPSAVPDNPVALTARRSAGSTVRLKWKQPRSKYFPVDDYSVYFSFNGKRWRPVTRVKATSIKLKVSRKSRYWFMVAANNTAGQGVPSKAYIGR
ncbi:MAG: fibronectin type III domain-containing protein [Actinobacteria bacterium]|nr:fibronectin type III domain-containing protein [Actinomycetota bacterium]